jgi:hypothetical protein
MINPRNDLGTRAVGRGAFVVGVVFALAALTMLARSADAQSPQELTAFDVRGTVVDADNSSVLAGAWVRISGSEWGSITDERGRFRLPDLDPGRLELTVEQLGYETLTWAGEVREPDGLLRLELKPSPVLLEGLQVVTDRFQARRNAVAAPVRAFDAADLSSTAQETALDFITLRAGTWITPCAGRYGDRCISLRGRSVEPTVYVDEMPMLGGLEYLAHIPPYELYMIEVYGSGRHIRAYTPQFMERAAKQRLQPIPLLF